MGSRRVIVLGSTGSIGVQTLEVIAHLNALHDEGRWPIRFEVAGLAAGRNADLLSEQCRRFGVRNHAVADGTERAGAGARHGPDAAERLVREVESDVVVAAMVGSAGLPATLAAVQAGRNVALANKETLVAAGGLIVPLARRTGSRILPIDSEHAGLWQCLAGEVRPRGGRDDEPAACPPLVAPAHVRRVILTASGGPFRSRSAREVHDATPEEALCHPTWRMGPKVTIDSATLTNKALEVIEAHWLFGLPSDRIGVLIHPQSIVHALVEFTDGSVLAQMAPPDMRAPIQQALSHPRRVAGLTPSLNWSALRALEFDPPDPERFPALALATRVIEAGGTAGAVLNAANEEAVAAFLARRIPFGRITEVTRRTLDEVEPASLSCLDDARRADARAREVARHLGDG